MPPKSNNPPKPRSEKYRPEIIRLPRSTLGRRAFRALVRSLLRALLWLFTRTEIRGLENFPRHGPALMVSNHLGDVDAVIGFAMAPAQFEAVSKAELYDFPLLGRVLDWYGVIWIHRGRADRLALRTVLDGLKSGRIIAIAPEGRESLSGELEEGTQGAAYLALKSGAPLVPVGFTGTENWRVYGNLKRFRRTSIIANIGTAFFLDPHPDRRQAVQQGTQRIMEQIARLLPPAYRGEYADRVADSDKILG